MGNERCSTMGKRHSDSAGRDSTAPAPWSDSEISTFEQSADADPVSRKPRVLQELIESLAIAGISVLAAIAVGLAR
jgi:ABC-type Fe3+ transport system permease subunit